LNNDRPYLIAGIDPGTTTGIAILDFDGELLSLFSSKDLSLDRVIQHLTGFGKGSLIAVDVKPAPGFVTRLATKLGSQLYVPEEPLHVSEKIELTRGIKTKNSHQRDALAAALTAHHKFKNKFMKIDSLGLGDEVKDLVLHGISINDAVEMLKGEGEEEIVEPEEERHVRIPSLEEIRIRKLEKQNSTLRKEIFAREKEMVGLKKEIAKVKESYRVSIRKEREIEKRDDIIKKLEKSVIELKGKLRGVDKLGDMLREMAMGKVKAVGVFPEVYDGLSMIKKNPRKKEFPLLGEVQIAFVDDLGMEKHLHGVGIFTADAKELEDTEGFLFIDGKKLQKIRKSKRVPLHEIVKNYRDGRD